MASRALARLRDGLQRAPLAYPNEAGLEREYPGARRGAVLALFYPRAGEPHLVLTQRTPTLKLHSGQISLPGGRIDPHDFSPAEAALRETREELGVPTQDLDLRGPLEPVFTQVSNFVLYPFVGFATSTPVFAPNPIEVAEIIELPLEHLLDGSAVDEEVWLIRGRRRRVGFYRFLDYKIWGATGRVLRQIVALAGGPAPPPGRVPPGEVEPAL